jgi:hypothetical protein
MDCDKVESVIIDELYGELDEVTSAAVKRHIAGCNACSVLLSGLRATQRVAALPLVAAPPDLEQRVLRAVGADLATARPSHHPFARIVSAAGSWAMRPQTAMAAVFLVMLGASVLLLRGRSSRAPASAEMIVTEKGTPAPAPVPSATAEPADLPTLTATSATGKVAAPKMPTQPATWPSPDVASGAARDRFMAKGANPGKLEETPLAGRADSAGNLASAPAAAPAVPAGRATRPARAAEDQEATEGPSSSTAGLASARAIRDSQGCRAAVARFDDVAQHASGSSAGWEALLESARCYRFLGDTANARARLTTLLGIAQFKDRARSELDGLERGSPSQPEP